MSALASAKRFLTLLPQAYDPSRSKGLEASIQFEFTGAQPENWYLKISDDTCELIEGSIEAPTISVQVDPKIFMDIQDGKMMANMAVSRSKMRLSGDLNLAFQLVNYFKLPNQKTLKLL